MLYARNDVTAIDVEFSVAFIALVKIMKFHLKKSCTYTSYLC